jgi:hypothetical protein
MEFLGGSAKLYTKYSGKWSYRLFHVVLKKSYARNLVIGFRIYMQYVFMARK